MNFPPQSWDDNDMDWNNAEFKRLNTYPLTYIAAIKEALRERYSALGRSTEFNQNITASLTPLSPVFEFIKALYQIEYAIYWILQSYNRPEWVRLATHNIYDGSTDIGPNFNPCERLWFLHAMEDAGYGAGENWIGFFTSISGFSMTETQTYQNKRLSPISSVLDLSKLGDWFRQKKALINLMRWTWSPYGENATWDKRIRNYPSISVQSAWSAAKSAILAQTPTVYSNVNESFNYEGWKTWTPSDGYQYLANLRQSYIPFTTSQIERTDEIYRYALVTNGDPSGLLDKDKWKLTSKIENTKSAYINIFPTDADFSGAPEPSTVDFDGETLKRWRDVTSGGSFVVQKFDGANGFKFRDW